MRDRIFKCKCRKCGLVVEMTQKELSRYGFFCPKCKHTEYMVIL
jgi:Zn finger protein HypA/HybF involved in hydrogenase expression